MGRGWLQAAPPQEPNPPLSAFRASPLLPHSKISSDAVVGSSRTTTRLDEESRLPRWLNNNLTRLRSATLLLLALFPRCIFPFSPELQPRHFDGDVFVNFSPLSSEKQSLFNFQFSLCLSIPLAFVQRYNLLILSYYFLLNPYEINFHEINFRLWPLTHNTADIPGWEGK